MTITEVGDGRMEALFRIIVCPYGRFYVKKDGDLLAKGRVGFLCEIGKRPKHKEGWQVVELVQSYPCDGIVCIRSIMRFEFNRETRRFSVKLRGKVIARGTASGIAGPGRNDRFPDLRYFALVRELPGRSDGRKRKP